MAIDFKMFLKVAPLVTDVRKPILLRGRHGVGKSQVVISSPMAWVFPWSSDVPRR